MRRSQPQSPPSRSHRETLPIPIIAPAPLGSSTWLLHLRWFAVVGQLLTILAGCFLVDVDLPYLPLLSFVVLTAVTNAIYGLWLRTLTPYVHRLSALFLIGAGAYLIYYWIVQGRLS